MRGPSSGPGAAKSLEGAARRARTRRAVALVGMFGAIGGLVGLRGTLSPPPTLALNSGLAAPVGARTAASSGRQPQHRSSIASHSSGSRSRSAHQVVVGGPFDVKYGIVQVKVTWTGTRITDVQTLSLPQGKGRSGDISRYAAPQLRRETLSAQSARIDTVSGASYTSAGYARSVQSALDKRGR